MGYDDDDDGCVMTKERVSDEIGCLHMYVPVAVCLCMCVAFWGDVEKKG